MPGVRSLAKVQMADEAEAGTAVAATFVWPGPFFPLEDLREVANPELADGIVGGQNYVVTNKLGGRLVMAEHPASFEALPVILAAGIQTGAKTPAGPGDPDGEYAYTGTFPTTAAVSPLTFTIESGDNQQAEEMEYCFVSEFKLTGAVDENWKLSATWLGRQVQTCDFTASKVVPTGLEYIPFNGTALYIDDSEGSIGDTEKSNTLIGAEFTYPTGYMVYGAASGQLYFAAVKHAEHEPTLRITFEHDSTGVAEIAKWRAKSIRLIRLYQVGSLIAGSTYKSLQINLAGYWESFEALGEQNGNHVARGLFKVKYSSADTLRGSIVVTNALSALP